MTFPGGTSVSRLSVYSGSACADGLEGGTPHLHTASTEAYVVVGGHGALLTLDLNGLRETRLSAGSTVWFTPGTIHRAVNHGDLEVVVVMQNAGLPEAGDAVMTFPPEIVSDPERYRAAATLPSGPPATALPSGPPATTLPAVPGLPAAGPPAVAPHDVEEAVARRRDLAVEGFLRLADSAARGDLGPLRRFYDSAVALVRPRVADWRAIWEDTVARETRHTAAILDALEQGDGAHLSRSALMESPPERRWGMCGHLRAHDVTHPIVRTPEQD
ncbi:cupin domain-containing protein [Nonomuraea jiangxiensis]|uniref:Cupin domain-containing protein n=1 Tax=Nonomuraea jiangxiensis TaxID=633440 RepID=A0A1G7ZCV2_9ACTN|nr:cupin domain-containing protein [Nonomuraea jiangxiensis]SDH06571.1 Cupin domain-containing protein [Nonomuraea jiangxiensis]